MERLLLLLILFLLGSYQSLVAQNRDYSLEHEMDRQYRLKILGLSESGKWAMVAKYYDRNRDTTMIVRSSTVNKNYLTIIGTHQVKSFVKDEAVLSFGNQKVEYTNLKTLEKTIYTDVKHINVLSGAGQYAILDFSETLHVFNAKGEKLYALTGIKNLPITDQHDQSFVYRENIDGCELIDISGTMPKNIYKTPNAIKRIEISSSENSLKVFETEKGSSAETLAFINIKNGAIFKPALPLLMKDTYLESTEISNGPAWLISANNKILNNEIVDIWYGNDGNLINKDRGFHVVSKYWHYDTSTGKLSALPSEYSSVIPTANKRFLLMYNNGELQNYVSAVQDISMNFYDLQSKKTIKLDTIKTATLIMPRFGNNILYRSMDDEWILTDLEKMVKTEIREKFLRDPAFSADGKDIYFESEKGLFAYNIATKVLYNTGIGVNQIVRIVNKSRSNLAGGNLNISIVQLPDGVPILIEIKNEAWNSISYVSLSTKKQKVLIPGTHDKIRELYYDRRIEKIWYSSENYNSPTAVYSFDTKKATGKQILSPNKNDMLVKNLKLEIINYQNIEGKSLKGLLYYPEGFDNSKIYPMIVRIYQIQSNTSNEYQVVGYDNPIAFDLRALIQKGYFVYLPDIVFERMGTGLSALDCVNSALNALSEKPYINFSKIGLTGHSHGGYETNFIATHSDRFTAYISGAGNSDIVRSYFSYNRNFHSPFYWQYENGQYKMPYSFSDDNELYFKNNPIHYVHQVNAPILLWAGQKDENIKWDQSLEFYIGLKRNRKNVIALFYPNQGHALGLGSPERVDLYKKVFDWWDYFLKGIEVPWINHQMKKDAL
ncbi:hypothetical protein ATE47_01305 [Chryseobacterium sp. IHB B 17019]|uniref:alpha/beta hydrolase family protein n=1 Tax=Chryseobacterium sp. IHB B 17019 TaxID=1721091 RepID=UPI00071F8AF3|nr:prolyl oligopeptidase family serine peptidase [Chryseobacterium sp. IHB B 17019]ALR29249.1 hypothetical protein ATE47_01305 [Chryseobacterium sp. IHB B 17019]